MVDPNGFTLLDWLVRIVEEVNLLVESRSASSIGLQSLVSLLNRKVRLHVPLLKRNS